jgi:hypothetical protein
LQNKTNKIFYTLQIKNPAETSKAQTERQNLLGEKEFNWKQIFFMPYKSTTDSTLRNVQYKYIQRIIATNKYLFKCNQSNTNLSDMCILYEMFRPELARNHKLNSGRKNYFRTYFSIYDFKKRGGLRADSGRNPGGKQGRNM